MAVQYPIATLLVNALLYILYNIDYFFLNRSEKTKRATTMKSVALKPFSEQDWE